jgi:hypothetical protein
LSGSEQDDKEDSGLLESSPHGSGAFRVITGDVASDNWRGVSAAHAIESLDE